MNCYLVIKGRPITKKNSSRYVGAGRLLPSKQYKAYEEDALWQLRGQWQGKKSIDRAVHVTALYYMPNRIGWPDLVGLEQATADILEKAGVIADDGFIADWDGSCIAAIDKENPRVKIFLDTSDCTLNYLHPKLRKGACK